MKRLAALAVACVLLAGCLPAPQSGYAPPSVEATIVTPSTALTYAFVMVQDGSGGGWWVQIGAKSDAAGFHVAVQAWRTLQSNYFERFDTLTPGSSHRFRIDWVSAGWRLWFDGRVMTTQNPGQCPPCSTEINYDGERTTA